MTLTSCMKKAGSALRSEDAAAIRAIYDELINAGVEGAKAEVQAVDEFLQIMALERSTIVDQIRDVGGDTAAAEAKLLYSKGTREQQLASKLDIVDVLYGNAGPIKAKEADKTADMFAPKTDVLRGTGPHGRVLNRDLQRWLYLRMRRANHGRSLGTYSNATPRVKEVMVSGLTNEVLAALRDDGHAAEWYSQTLHDARSLAILEFPELETDATASTIFDVLLASYSNGSDMTANADLAFKAYEHYRSQGTISEKILTGGRERPNQLQQIRLLNDAISKMGLDNFVAFINTPFTIKELREMFPDNPGIGGNELVNFQTYGSAIMGPKLGMFYQNIHGNYAVLTMDRWFTRTMRRYLADVDPREDSAAWDIPRNGSERNFFREIIQGVVERVRALGHDTNMASIQATLWYPEKKLYVKYGGTSSRGKETDFRAEFTRILKERGYKQDSIDAAIAVGRSRRAGVAGADPVAEPVEEAPRAEGLAYKRDDGAIDRLRRSGAPAYDRTEAASGETVLDAAVAQRFSPSEIALKTLGETGLSTPDFVELGRSPQSARRFFELISAAKAAHPDGAAVFIYDQAEYEDMRTFITEDGTAGFALKQDDIVSVFKHPKSPHKGVVHALMQLAIREGGRRLDAFDTILPHLYGQHGFEVAARVAWNEKYAPEGWDKSRFKDYNEGEPDVVYMAYDPNRHTPYEPGEGPLVDVETAERLQAEAVVRNSDRVVPEEPLQFSLPERDPNASVEEDPLVALHRMSATMEQQAAYDPGYFRKMKDNLSEAGRKAQRGVLALIPRRHVIDFVDQRKMPAGKEYVRLANRQDGRRNELISEAAPLAQKWNKWTSKNKEAARILGEVMHGATIAGVDPALEYQPLYKNPEIGSPEADIEAKRQRDHQILRRHWLRMPEEAKEIYVKVRQHYSAMRKKVEQALEDRINATGADGQTKKAAIVELRKVMESGRVTGPYFPLSRYGDYWAAARDKNGDVVAFSRFEKAAVQKEWIKSMNAAGFKTEQGIKTLDKDIAQTVNPEFAARITELANKMGAPDIADEIWQSYLRSLPEMSMRKMYLHRKGRLGFSMDAMRAFGNSVFHGSHQLARLEYNHQLEGALSRMRDQAANMASEDHKDQYWAASVYTEMRARHEYAQQPRASSWATKVTGFGFLWYLGATPAAAIVNLTQTPLLAFPVLGAKYNFFGAMTELSKAATLMASSLGPLKNRLRGEERQAFEAAERAGMFEKTQAHDIAGISEEGEEYGGRWQTVMEWSAYMFHKTEQWNREVTFLAAYRLARKAGRDHEAAIYEAEDLVWDSHFDYNNANRPRISQNEFAKIIFLFRNYSWNMTYRMARDIRESVRFGPDVDPVARRQAQKRFGGVVLMSALFAGVTGLPFFFWSAVRVLEAMLSDDDDPFRATDELTAYLEEMYGKKAAIAIMRGPWDALTGMTLSTRVSLAHLWYREPDPSVEGRDKFAHYLGEIAGPVPGIFEDMFTAGAAYQKTGDPMRAAEYFMPKFVEDVMKAFRFMSEGAQSFRGDVYMDQEEFENIELFWQAIGFIPADLQHRYDSLRAARDTETRLMQRKQNILDRMFAAARARDQRLIRELREEVRDFNRANPRTRITGATIAQSMQQRRERTREGRRSHGLVMADKDHRYLLEQFHLTE